MDDINRVKNIKEKFESKSYIRNIQNETDQTNHELNDCGAIHRPNIRRTPAFRRDKIPRNVDKLDTKSTDSLVTNRVHLFNKLEDVPKSDNDDIKENKPQKIQYPNDVNINQLKVQNINELKRVIQNQAESKPECSAQQYAKVKKSKKTPKPKKPEENGIIHQKTAPELSQKSNLSMDELSDTLKRVLRSPLPPGPPPKKPPRTFVVKPEVHNCDKAYGKINKEMPKPIRSKTESELMLKKIENALIKHQEHGLSLNRKTEEDGSRSKHDLNCFSSKCSSQEPECSKPGIKEADKTVSNTVQYATIKNHNADHIYEDPSRLRSSVSPNKEINDSNLYYMSTPIDSIISSTNMDHFAETPESKAMNSISDLLDKSFEDENGVLNDPTLETKIKIWMNEAYSNTKSFKAVDVDPELGSNDTIDTSVKEESHSDQFDQVTLLRKGYVQRVASRISRQQSILVSPSSKHLFECLLLIGLNLDNFNNKVPYIKMKYPANTGVPQWIEHLCFPDAHEWSNIVEKCDDGKNSCYTITVTTQGGQRKYVYCRRIQPEGETTLLPLSYCLLSSHKANEFYYRILEEIESRHGKTEVEFFNFIRELYENKFPTRGQGIIIRASDDGMGETRDEIVKRPADSRLEDLQLAKTLECVKVDVFLLIFSSMLLERKVILLSSSISKLSTCMEGLQIAFSPFQWQHTLITVVPSSIISITDLCEAPTPYLIGLLKPKDNSQDVPNLNNGQQVIVVDIDDSKLVRKVGDEQSILPNHLTKGLKNALQLAHSSEAQTNNLLACEAFMRLFVELIGNYRRFIISSNLDRVRRKSFQKEAFLRSVSNHSTRMFLVWFVETPTFLAFIESYLQNSSDSRDLFEHRCNEYIEELNRVKYNKNNKVMKTVKQIGDFFKDLTAAP